MESVKIETLLEKYFEAKTSIEEERFLKEYFSKSDIPPHLEVYKGMFNYFTSSALDTSKRNIQVTNRSAYVKWLSIAAMLIFFVSLFGLYRKNQVEKEQARLAYVETQKALQLISHSLNKGTEAMAHLENFNKGTEAMAQLETYNRTQNRIFNP